MFVFFFFWFVQLQTADVDILPAGSSSSLLLLDFSFSLSFLFHPVSIWLSVPHLLPRRSSPELLGHSVKYLLVWDLQTSPWKDEVVYRSDQRSRVRGVCARARSLISRCLEIQICILFIFTVCLVVVVPVCPVLMKQHWNYLFLD